MPKKSKLQMMPRPQPSVEGANSLMEEVRDYGREFGRYLSRFKRLKNPESEQYFDQLIELWTSAEVVRMKAVHTKQEIDRLLTHLENAEEQREKQAVRGHSRRVSDAVRRRAS